jgi:AraC family transcriptional regulator of adaptative response / DNA-3-methyladenine glycosylase II
MPSTHAPSEALQSDACYLAMKTHDARFDGSFFTAVTSTGIYCRPVCRVKLPRRENCRFFVHAAQAEAEGFRPCLRCRPELAPRAASWSTEDASRILALQAARLIDEPDAWVHGDDSGPGAAQSRGAPGRERPAPAAHLRGAVRRLPASIPADAAPLGRQAADRRHAPADDAGGAGQRLCERAALQCGLRRALRPQPERAAARGRRQGRRRQGHRGAPGLSPALRRERDARLLRAPRPAWRRGATTADGKEPAKGSTPTFVRLARTLRVQQGGQAHAGWLQLRFDIEREQMLLSVSDSLAAVLPIVISRARAMLDLDAEPMAINAALHAAFPHGDGLRVPGTVDGFELAVRAVLGQQITVAAARTLGSRLVQAFGEPIATPIDGLDRLFPTPAAIAAASGDALGQLGIVRQRQAALQAIAREVADGKLALHAGADVPSTIAALQELPGIGAWTAQYIAMRALRWPDAFPAGDIALQKALGVTTARAAGEASQAWRPWRSYAVLRAWHAPSPSSSLPRLPRKWRQILPTSQRQASPPEMS